jgi:hypothetical protein
MCAARLLETQPHELISASEYARKLRALSAGKEAR